MGFSLGMLIHPLFPEIMVNGTTKGRIRLKIRPFGIPLNSFLLTNAFII